MYPLLATAILNFRIIKLPFHENQATHENNHCSLIEIIFKKGLGIFECIFAVSSYYMYAHIITYT